jgi:hypothetical protein
MGILDVIDAIKKFAYEFLNKSIDENIRFFSKPDILNKLKELSASALNSLLEKLKTLIGEKISLLLDQKDFASIDLSNITNEDVENYIKNNGAFGELMNSFSRDLNESLISDIVLACENPDYYQIQANNLAKILENLSGNDYIKIAQEQSDFDEKLKSFTIDEEIETALNKIKGVLPWLFLVYYVILKVIEFLTQNDYPSKYRGKYLQRLIRNIARILSTEFNALKDIPNETKELGTDIWEQIKDIINVLKSMDAIIVGSLLASFVYINNRKKYQTTSLYELKAIDSSYNCKEIPNELTDEETRTQITPLDTSDFINISCSIDSEPAVPHEPFELKLANDRITSCPIDEDPSMANIEGTLINDTASKIIVENKSSKKFSILVNRNQQVDTRTILGTLGDTQIYSPVNGIVSIIKDNSIYLNDISDPDKSYVEETITKIQELYDELNNTKFIINDFFIDSWYPVMIKYSPLLDISLNDYSKIIYRTGGVWKRFETAKKSKKSMKESYEKNVKKTMGKDNVEKKSRNEQLNELKNEIDNLEKTYYNNLLAIGNTAINQAKVTQPKQDEFANLEYYLDLYESFISSKSSNSLMDEFISKLNTIIINRYFADKWNLKKLEIKLNTLCDDIAKGTFFASTQNFFSSMLTIYYQNRNVDEVESYVIKLGKKNTEYTEDEKTEAIKRVMHIFNFILTIINKPEEEYRVEYNRYDLAIEEANFIEGFFDKRWKRYNEIPIELEAMNELLEDLSNTFTSYSIIKIDDEQYRYYCIGEERTCPIPDELATESEYKNIKYWLRYCAVATLTSVLNFPRGWSTGLPPPIGPILFPVIYMPLKAFQLKWGMIVLGLSITGIYVFPWVLFANLSMNYHVPLADPATIIQKQVDSLKKTLDKQVKNYRQETLKKYLDNMKKEIDKVNVSIDEKTEEKRLHKLERPVRDRENQETTLEYADRITEWDKEQFNFTKELTVLKTERFSLETKYKIIYDSYSMGAKVGESADPIIKSIEKTEESIDEQFVKLDQLIASIDPIIAPLPISTQPESANFAFTLKNPRPIINIDTKLNENIDTDILDGIIKPFKLKNEDFMSSNFANKIPNWNTYKGLLTTNRFTIIQKDAFPKYEELKITNLPWINFLYNNWTVKGAQSFGFPGQAPFPVN